MDKYLPIGSVVLLKGAEKKIMIIGILQEETPKDEKESPMSWDYIGVMYPYGFTGVEELLVFNHDSIDSVFATGYTNNEYLEFRQELEEYLKEKSE